MPKIAQIMTNSFGKENNAVFSQLIIFITQP